MIQYDTNKLLQAVLAAITNGSAVFVNSTPPVLPASAPVSIPNMVTSFLVGNEASRSVVFSPDQNIMAPVHLLTPPAPRLPAAQPLYATDIVVPPLNCVLPQTANKLEYCFPVILDRGQQILTNAQIPGYLNAGNQAVVDVTNLVNGFQPQTSPLKTVYCSQLLPPVNGFMSSEQSNAQPENIVPPIETTSLEPTLDFRFLQNLSHFHSGTAKERVTPIIATRPQFDVNAASNLPPAIPQNIYLLSPDGKIAMLPPMLPGQTYYINNIESGFQPTIAQDFSPFLLSHPSLVQNNFSSASDSLFTKTNKIIENAVQHDSQHLFAGGLKLLQTPVDKLTIVPAAVPMQKEFYIDLTTDVDSNFENLHQSDLDEVPLLEGLKATVITSLQKLNCQHDDAFSQTASAAVLDYQQNEIAAASQPVTPSQFDQLSRHVSNNPLPTSAFMHLHRPAISIGDGLCHVQTILPPYNTPANQTKSPAIKLPSSSTANPLVPASPVRRSPPKSQCEASLANVSQTIEAAGQITSLRSSEIGVCDAKKIGSGHLSPFDDVASNISETDVEHLRFNNTLQTEDGLEQSHHLDSRKDSSFCNEVDRRHVPPIEMVGISKPIEDQVTEKGRVERETPYLIVEITSDDGFKVEADSFDGKC